jgi:hypothetical protein
MVDKMADKRKVSVMKMWVKRRRDRGMEPNADAIWARIKENWPYMLQEELEEIFHEVK